MVVDMWYTALDLFRAYMGTGLILIWFLAAWIYLLLKERRKPVRIMFVYVPGILLFLFFNPIFSGILYNYIEDEIYYRILWLIPISSVIALAAVHIYKRLSGKKQYLFAATAAVCLMISGSYMYSNPFFHKAENIYHVPQSVVDICDAIEVEGREVKAVFPAELIQYVRQYSPLVCMPYGREITVERWKYHNDLYDVMEGEEIDAKRLTELARDQLCHYIILAQDKSVNGNLPDYDYDLFGQMDGYVIYKDNTVTLEYR